jgi:predicted RNase H-like nuclease
MHDVPLAISSDGDGVVLHDRTGGHRRRRPDTFRRMTSPTESTSSPTMNVAGVDGCRTGWVVALLDIATGGTSLRVVTKFSDVLALREEPVVVAVDMPIGLLDAAEHGGRECDPLARELLGWPRRNSVFSPPVRGALEADTFAQAGSANRASSPLAIGISRQSFGIFEKLREVDAAMSPTRQARVIEVHPELSFFEMLGGKPMGHGKKTLAGRAERLGALTGSGLLGPGASLPVVPGAKADDVLDALAACWTARRIHGGQAVRVPSTPPLDARGLRMEIWR